MIVKLICSVIVCSALGAYQDAECGIFKNIFSKKDKVEKTDETDVAKEPSADEKKDEASTDSSSTATPGEPSETKEAASDSDTKDSQASGDKKKIVGDPVVIRIKKKEFRRSQVLADIKNLPQQLIVNIPPEKLFVLLREQKIKAFLMREHAKKMGIDKSKDYKEQLSRMEDELLLSSVLQKEIKSKIENETAMKAMYVKYESTFKKGSKEYEVCHIMLKDEANAKIVLAELAKGEAFEEVAKKRSEAPSKADGGKEGFIPVDMLPAPIKDKIVAVKIGDYTKEPIKTEMGHHIFKVISIRDAAPKSYEESKPMLKQMIMQEEMVKFTERLEKQCPNIERYTEDGSLDTVPAAIPAAAAAAA